MIANHLAMKYLLEEFRTVEKRTYPKKGMPIQLQQECLSFLQKERESKLYWIVNVSHLLPLT